MSAALKGRVLFIDDEPGVLRSLQWLLQREFEVHTCDSPANALRMARQHDFDVVVSDQRMPGITGVDLLRHVRKFAPRAMRILLTGYADLDAMVNSVNEGEVYRFVTKPWDPRALPGLLAEAAEAARSAPVAADEDAAPAPDAARETVLVIDGRADLHADIAASLGAAADVLHACDLATAVRLLDAHRVAVIVSEAKVGGKDATGLVRMLKASRPEIVALVVSGMKDALSLMTLINQGQVYRIVLKPVKPGSVKPLVESALKRHRLLAASPALKRRFAVEPTARGVADSLLEDVMATCPPAGIRPGMIDGLKSGFRRLFGVA